MRILRFQAKNFRNINEVALEPGTGLNVFTGLNACGKTAILEAIHVLSRGKSFRSARVKDIVQFGKESLVVSAHIGFGENLINTGIEKRQGKTIIHYNGDVVKQLSSQAKNLPVLLVLPDSHLLITGDPRARRHWLDWAMFHVKPDYLEKWKSYHKALRHRNALLKNTANDTELSGWEQSMSDYARFVNDDRRIYLEKIQVALDRLIELEEWKAPLIHYEPGWDQQSDLDQSLLASRALDRETGFTRNGIHRSEIVFKDGDKLMAKVCSRGQIKKYVACLILAQCEVMKEMTGETPIFLIDDYSAELDSVTREKLINRLDECGSQVFLTMTEPDRSIEGSTNLTRFHVEHGRFNKVVD